MKVNIQTIPHKEQRYETPADYWVDKDGVTQFRISEMVNPDYEFFLAIHELVEKFFVDKEGIDIKDIDKFDKHFEDMRRDYPDLVGDMEPGDHEDAPYNKQHKLASMFEKWIFDNVYRENNAEEWEKYNKEVYRQKQ